MPEVRTTNLRFNLGKESQRKAWQYLRTMDKSVFKSYSQAVATAVVDYFDRYYQTQDDPYLETRAREEQFVQQIVDAVRDALRETMPVFLAGCMTGMAQNPAAVSPQLVKEPVKDSINWDFVGEYPDVVSGLSYCKRCHSPRRTRQVLFGKERILPIVCRCRMEDAAFVQSGGTNGNKQRQNFSFKTYTPKHG